MEINIVKSNMIADLQERGYQYDFGLEPSVIVCLQDKSIIDPDYFAVSESFCFEDDTMLYAIDLHQDQRKGILLTTVEQFNSGLCVRLWAKLFSSLEIK